MENNNEGLKKGGVNGAILTVVILLVIAILASVYFMYKKDAPSEKTEVQNNDQYLAYRLSGNSLEDFDLYFLQVENEKRNQIYSPLSIKYALEMLKEGARGETKEQLSNIIGTYQPKKYPNNKNMSFANGLFVKDSYKNSIKSSYVDTLSRKYNAEIVYDSFKTPDALNSWVSDRTFQLVNNMADDISNLDFILVNALAIDMEWVNKIQNETSGYYETYAHENYSKLVRPLSEGGYYNLDFNGLSKNAQAVEFGAAINKYDIVNTLGEDKIREIVGNEYKKWLASEDMETCGFGEPTDVDTYLNNYINQINENYKKISSSTDFSFYTDDNVKVFAKDLKEYNGTTLQYVSIMPTQDSLQGYIKKIGASDINTLINSLKPIELNSFKEGVVTEITGYVPMFKFDYELDLIKDFDRLGVTRAFDPDKADLSNISNDKPFISQATHKANIEFSNNGIKAAAATTMGGDGAANCGFDYFFDVPVEKIDLTFDKPYIFVIRDKNSGEVWFTGTVYEPSNEPLKVQGLK